MATNKVEMSLDDIIKAGKNKGKQNSVKGRKFVNKNRSRKTFNAKGGRVIQKRNGQKKPNTPKQATRRNAKNTRQVNSNARNTNNKRNKAINTVATKKLVQKLVKKALAQRNVSVPATRPAVRRRGAVRVVRRAVVLNRVNARSRNIRRRNVVPMAAPVRQRIVYNAVPQKPQTVQLVPVRNFAPRTPRFVERPVVFQEVRQRRQPRVRAVYQDAPYSNNQNRSVRAQINAMRRRMVVFNPRPQVVQRANYSRQRVAVRRAPRVQRRQRDPFYEPQNFLQRI